MNQQIAHDKELNIIHFLTIAQRSLRLEHGLVGCWLFTMVAIPIVRWLAGDTALRWGVILSVCWLALGVFVTLWRAWGGWLAVRALILVALLGWAIEWVGSHTGLPFGRYHYTPALQPQVAGVPLLIPLAWFMMLPPAWAIAERVCGKVRDVRFSLISAGAFTAWDLFLDPQMVGWGYWVWETEGGYFGIPWLNFVGWFAAATVITLIIRPAPLNHLLLMVIYLVTWLLQSIGQLFFWQMPGPALIGFMSMGLFVWWAWRRDTIGPGIKADCSAPIALENR